MGRKKGDKNKHHKEKPHKEKKKKGRPKGSIKQKQSQSININIGGGDDNNSRRRNPSLPVQLPTSIFNPSLITPDFGINDRQPVNPLTDTTTDLLTPFFQAMIANSQQEKTKPIKTQPTKPTPPKQNPIVQPPIIETPITEQPIKEKPKPETKKPPEPEVIKPPEPPPPSFKPEDVQKYIEKIHEKDKVVEMPPNEPKPVEKGLVDNIIGFASDSINKLVSAPTDKYDGLKMKNKTMPVSKVIKGTIMGGAMGVAGGMAGSSILNNAAVTIASAGGGYIGNELDGEQGAMIGSMIGGIGAAKAMDKINPVYPERNASVRMREEYEEIPNGSLVNGGTVIASGRTTGRTTASKKSDTKPLHNRLFDAIKEVNTTSASTAEVKQKIKESRLLKEIEKNQKYGTYDTNIEPSEAQPSTLENFKEGVKRIYRRLSGRGGYERLPTQEEPFEETLKKTKTTKKGTYAILPQEEPIDIEQELEKMKRKTPVKTSPVKTSPVKPWPAMEAFGRRNERSIRESVERVDREEAIKRQAQQLLGIDEPERPTIPSTPMRKQRAARHFSKLTDKVIDEHYKKQLETIKREQGIKRRKKQVKTTDPRYDITVPLIDKEQARQNAKQLYDSIPRPESAQSLQASKLESLKRASTMDPQFRLSLTTQEEAASLNRIKRAYKRRLQRVEAKHELDKNRLEFDPDRYQQLLRENLKKANDSLSHYRTRVSTEKLTPEQKRAISRSKKVQISVPHLAKPKATGRPLGSRKKE